MNTRNLHFRSNRVRDILTLFHQELDPLYGVGEVGTFCEMLFEAFLGWDKVHLLISKDNTIDQSDLLRFHWALEDLRQYRPIQHIIGHTDFCGCRIEVNPDVLIPRPETEELVHWIVNNFSFSNFQFSILDLCTGSGCIAIALKKAFPQAEVTAVDVSEKALATAQRNAEANGTEIHFLQADLLNPKSDFRLPISNLIVSNPPYVRESERRQMQRNVLDHDPALALFVPDEDPLCFYRPLATIAKTLLAPAGLFVAEINEAFADEVCTLLHKQHLSPAVHIDFRGKARWVTAS